MANRAVQRGVFAQPEVAIVGGGVAGGALAAVLARRGLDVAVLEKDACYKDRVRGEYITPWGVAELNDIGLLSVAETAGGAYMTRCIGYCEELSTELAEASALDMRWAHPRAPGPMCISHPALCAALTAAATDAGARVFRGVANVTVQTGSPPTIGFGLNGLEVTWRPRLILGADGRNSLVRKQAGIQMQADPPHNLLGGMLVEGVPEWPADTFSLGTEGEMMYYVFPMGGGKLRLYTCYGYKGSAHMNGHARQQKLLKAFNMKCLPLGEKISRAIPIGPFNSFPNEDHWSDVPVAEGVTLVGDAAGYNDPIGGQGLAIAFRDVRIVSEIVSGRGWSKGCFDSYVEQRKEYMRRLRITTRLMTMLRVEFGSQARQRRAVVHKRAFVDRQLSPLPCIRSGPESLPREAFEQKTIDALLAGV